MLPKLTYDPTTGLALNAKSSIGGVRSRHVEEAIAEGRALNPTIANHLPPFLLGKIWAPPDQSTSLLAHDPDRYTRPTPEQQEALGLTDAQVDQIIWNLQLQNNFAVGTFREDQRLDRTPQEIYRGEPDHPGFPAYVPETIQIYNPSGDGLIPHEVTPTEHALKFQFGSPSSIAVSQNGPFQQLNRAHFFGDHILLDPWWDVQTGVNLARYYRSFMRAHGVDVAAEPQQ